MSVEDGANPSAPGAAAADAPSQSFPTQAALLGAILDASDLLVVVLDAAARVVLFNRACQRASGYTAAEVVGGTLEHLLAPEERAATEALLQGIPAGRYPHRHVSQWVGKGGRRRLIRWSNTALRDAQGRIEWVIGTGVDISGLERTGQSLHETRRRVQAVLDTAVDGIVVIDPQGIIETFNPAAERMFGYGAAEVIGRNVSMLMPSPYREQHDEFIRRYLETGERHIIGIGREVVGLRKNGEVFPIELAVGEVHLPDKRLFTGTVRDIGERKRIEREGRQHLDELAHASRLAAMGEMTSSIAHELNQPLAAIVSFADACLRMERSGKGNPDTLRNALGQIRTQGERAGRMIRRLRRFVRKTQARYETLTLHEVIEEVLRLVDHDLRHHQVRVQLELDEALPTVRADRLQIEQVMLNLVRNAIDAMQGMSSEQTELRIRTGRARGTALEVSVCDRGIGLSPEARQHLFEPFYTTKPQGLGMGLSISRSIIEAHGGRLWASNNPGQGATFQFTLPLDGDPAN